MSENTKQYVVCIHNEDSEHSLELRKIYEAVDDAVAAKHNMIRVIDEEDEDYLYPAAWFLPIELPHNLVEAFAQTPRQS